MEVALAPIADADIEAVSRFMHDHHNRRVAPEQWARALRMRWSDAAPHHGFLLRAEGDIVGAYLAYFSEREVDGHAERFCNLGAWCVREEHRAEGLRLAMALVRMRGYHFTDLSPSGSVVALDRAMGFTELDTSASAMPNLPWRTLGVRVTGDPDRIDAALSGAERRVWADHRAAAAARHLIVLSGEEQCYIIFRRDRRKRVRAFASILHVSNPDLFRRAVRDVGAHLLLHHGIAVTLLERRVVGDPPPGTVALPRTRPKMFKSSALASTSIDYLYSELVALEW
ncbi:hypothetical protein [Agrococcus carbonis]|uniref:N-acetyltransferase domain-containing protein n=1 Tax=Agrococcus carbonis TaxID=684552 RepID=A0A1H1LDV6_9MICO|nr:hypothetical protein [Agrococcus carbonis]SDR72049.1 hypothetical protein SAMN04489719_0524 [Agrococcus carbonis]